MRYVRCTKTMIPKLASFVLTNEGDPVEVSFARVDGDSEQPKYKKTVDRTQTGRASLPKYYRLIRM